MLIATVPYVGKRLHLDPEPDPKLNYGYGSEHANNFGSGSEHANNFGSGRIRIHNPAYIMCHKCLMTRHFVTLSLFNLTLCGCTAVA